MIQKQKSRLSEVFNDSNKLERIKTKLWQKINVGNEDECWEWQAKTVHEFGYGIITHGTEGKKLKAHRVAYALANGIIADTDCVLHRCDNPKCCNPKHLFIGTRVDNIKDCIKKERNSPPPHPLGEKHHNTKFTAKEAMSILLDTRKADIIAKEYGVTGNTVRKIKRRETWKELFI